MTVAREHRVRPEDPKVPRGRARQRREELLDLVGLAGWATATRTSSPAASSSAWRSRGRSRTSPRCCCSTSRSARWTSRSARSCAEPQGDPAPAEGHDHPRHPRPGGGVRAGRPHRRHGRGRLVEVGRSQDLYSKPRSLFAATFLGAGTVLVGRCREGRAEFGSLSFRARRRASRGRSAGAGSDPAGTGDPFG